MAMGAGGAPTGGGPTHEINMTPMIDVLLVLLIIFMVIQPALQKGVEVQVPPIEERAASQADPDQIVLEIRPGPQYFINQVPVPAEQLGPRIRAIYQNRPRKIIFIKGAESLTYGDVIEAVDIARGAGVEVVGLVPRES